MENTSLEIEIKQFVNSLPYWAQYICSKFLDNANITDTDIETAYSFLKEELGLLEKTGKPEIKLNYKVDLLKEYKDNLYFKSIKNIQGVNALSEKQFIEFNPQLTVIYGVNGSGKSGYVRLFKKSFYSKHIEDILPNVFKTKDEIKPIFAEFYFVSDDTVIKLKYPDDAENGIFNQFSVFDGKVAIKHLTDRNNFEYRPAGLRLFSEFNCALEKLQEKLNIEIATKQIDEDFSSIFDGESEISNFINNISTKSDLEILKKHLPFTEEDQKAKQKAEKDYDDLKIALSSKDKEIKHLRDIKKRIEIAEKRISEINKLFKQETLNNLAFAIKDYHSKQEISKNEGAEKFKTDTIKHIGSSEWLDFIKSAEKFALKQYNYPKIGDKCLFCHQVISKEQEELISNYWLFLKSEAEKQLKDAENKINTITDQYKNINFDLFHDDSTLTIWLGENYLDSLSNLKDKLNKQKELSIRVAEDLESKTVNNYIETQIDLNIFEKIKKEIDSKVKSFQNEEQSKKLNELLKLKTYYIHKEKLEQQFSKIEKHYQDLIWVEQANKFNKQSYKRQSTIVEKRLSDKYFGDKYIDIFNNECKLLNANFGIEIDARSTDAKSNRKLLLKGKTPSDILSEGEQKVIAIADFIAETTLTMINKGIVFDDPVNSLDDERKSVIAERLVREANNRQVIVFTHDLVFLASLINYCKDTNISFSCHWIEKNDNETGNIWLNNAPSYEKKYKTSSTAQEFYKKAKDAQPEERELYIKNGFAALISSYEAFVIFELFAGVVQRFNERVSIDSLSSIYFDDEIIQEIMNGFGLACRYMEGHSHSDKFQSIKPTLEKLNEEIQRFDKLKKKLRELKKAKNKK